MRFALWTCCLIFTENFFLSRGYSSDRTFEINGFADNQKTLEIFPDLGEDSDTTPKIRLPKLTKFIKEKLGLDESKSDRIRHARHGNSVHRHFSNNVANELGDFKEPEIASKKATSSKVEPMAYKLNEEKMSNDDTSSSPVSQQKIQNLGTNEKVKELFKNKYGTLPASIRNADDERNERTRFLQHYEEMIKKTACKSPTPKIIKVDDLYPDVLKKYYPPCTIIHQCLEDSGCCSNGKVCAPQKTENITLYFKAAAKSGNTYERLSFINHTECACSSKKQRMVRDSSHISAANYETSTKNNDVPNMKRCRCPTPFSTRIMADGNCVCDCYDKQFDCLRFKRGMENFSLMDMYCMITGKCEYPICNYGEYMNKRGRCPKIHEKSFSD